MNSELTQRINTLILQRVRYGMRTEVASSKGYCLIWSNAGACWYIATSYGQIKRGEELNIDANWIFVPLMKGEKKQDVVEVLPSLKQLPLYGNSFECVYGGKSPS